MSFSESSKVEHQFYPSINEIYDDGMIISVILDCFYHLEYVKQSIQSVIEQDYNNVELMLIDNGAFDDVSDYLKEIHAKNNNTSLVTYKENQFSWDARDKAVGICWNAGLIHCKGEIVTHLGYDDMLSTNYAARMVRLFSENSKCMTAGPLPIVINSSGEIKKNSDCLPENNRTRYTDGKKLALDFVKGSPEKLFSAPGEILVIRKSLLFELSGFEDGIDLLQILKYAIHGDVGFDPKAHVYWRSHENQLNAQASAKGHIGVRQNRNEIKRSNIINIWKDNFSLSEVKLLEIFLKNKLSDMPKTRAQNMISNKNLYGLFLVFFHTARECPNELAITIIHSIFFASRIIISKLK